MTAVMAQMKPAADRRDALQARNMSLQVLICLPAIHILHGCS